MCLKDWRLLAQPFHFLFNFPHGIQYIQAYLLAIYLDCTERQRRYTDELFKHSLDHPFSPSDNTTQYRLFPT